MTDGSIQENHVDSTKLSGMLCHLLYYFIFSAISTRALCWSIFPALTLLIVYFCCKADKVNLVFSRSDSAAVAAAAAAGLLRVKSRKRLQRLALRLNCLPPVFLSQWINLSMLDQNQNDNLYVYKKHNGFH